MKVKQAYLSMPITPIRYFAMVLFPATLLSVAGIAVLMISMALPPYMEYVFYAIPAFIFTFILVYPLIRTERDEGQIDQEMHLFITRMGILSLSEISGKSMFYILEEMREYGRLAIEVNKVYNLVNNLKINLSEACREVARKTPSEVLADFLNRLAHAIETGEDAREFFRKEQEVVMDQYAIKYEASLTGLGVMNEVFVAIVVVATLIVSMFLIVPMLVDMPLPPLGMLVLGAFLFGIIEGTFLFAYWIVLPRERIWQKGEIPTKTNRTIFMWFLYSFLICDVVAGLLAAIWVFFDFALPIPISIALILTPLTISGYKASIEESEIKKKEDRYPAFMRSLGISAAAKGGVAREALSRLRHHDFGPLTTHINDLYKRLAMRVDEIRSWKYFDAEVGSDLISKFSDMYVRGTLAGAKPKEASGIVSTNFIKMLQLRKKRYMATSILTYILYIVTLTMAITVFLTIYTVDWITQFAYSMPPTDSAGFSYIIPVLSNPSAFSIPGLVTIGLLMIIINAFICATIIRMASAGHSVNFLLHFVGLVWTGALTATFIEYAMVTLRLIGG